MLDLGVPPRHCNLILGDHLPKGWVEMLADIFLDKMKPTSPARIAPHELCDSEVLDVDLGVRSKSRTEIKDLENHC